MLVLAPCLDQVIRDSANLRYTDAILTSNLTGETLLICQQFTGTWYEREKIYVNSGSGMSRNYSLMRGLLPGLGFPGYSGKEVSLFYPYNDTVSSVSPDDWKAVTMMYNKDFSRNESKSPVKARLNWNVCRML